MDIPRLRLHNQRIATSRPGTVHGLVSFMGAMQAQDYYGALLAIGLRTGKTEREVITAIENAEIVRTWPQRGTLHFVAPEDALWMTQLSAPRLLSGGKRRHEQLGLDEAAFERSLELFTNALKKEGQLTRPQMLALLEENGIGTGSNRGYHLLWRAAQRGITYIGPMDGKQQTFRLLSNLATAHQEFGRPEAAGELATRYFLSHGPATLQDFGWWSGLTVQESKQGLEAAKPFLRSHSQDGKEYWMSPDATENAQVPEACLLPGFDEFILGYKDRSAQMKPEYAAKIVPGSNGMFLSTVVVRGQVVGTWKRSIKKASVQLAILAFEPLSKAEKAAISQAAEGYGRFVGLPAEISFS